MQYLQITEWKIFKLLNFLQKYLHVSFIFCIFVANLKDIHNKDYSVVKTSKVACSNVCRFFLLFGAVPTHPWQHRKHHAICRIGIEQLLSAQHGTAGFVNKTYALAVRMKILGILMRNYLHISHKKCIFAANLTRKWLEKCVTLHKKSFEKRVNIYNLYHV